MEVLFKFHYGSFHLLMGENPITIVEHFGHYQKCIVMKKHYRIKSSQFWGPLQNTHFTFRFDGITNGDDLINFFEEYFRDSIPLLGKDKMIEDYFNTKPLPLISIKVGF